MGEIPERRSDNRSRHICTSYPDVPFLHCDTATCSFPRHGLALLSICLPFLNILPPMLRHHEPSPPFLPSIPLNLLPSPFLPFPARRRLLQQTEAPDWICKLDISTHRGALNRWHREGSKERHIPEYGRGTR